MRSSVACAVLAVVAAFAGCSKPPDEPAPPAAAPTPRPDAGPQAAPAVSPLVAAESAWTAASADGRFAVTQAATASGCALVATEVATRAERWRSTECAAFRADLVFVSPDGERLLVLHRAAASARDVAAATFVSILERGRTVRALRGAEIVAPDRLAAVRSEGSWARGLGPRAGGPRPAYADQDRVRVETFDGAAILLAFDGTLSRPGRAVGGAAAGSAGGPAHDDESGLWKWTDDAGEIHFASGADVPDRYRHRARPVRAQVGTIAVERIDTPLRSQPSYTPTGPLSPAREAPEAPRPPPKPPQKTAIQEIIEAKLFGYGGVKINQNPQICTTNKNGITECRDAPARK